MEIIERRENGSFVILNGKLPYHVIPSDPLWETICQQEGLDPVAQAEKYAESLEV